MAIAIGKVAVLEGQAFARSKDGTQRALKVGDAVMAGEVIVTGPNSHVELDFDGGQTYLVREQETVTLDKTVFGADLPESHDAALVDSVAETAAITRAIAEGSSLDELLEETAAGLDGGGSENGHDFVRLLRIVEAVPPLDYGYGIGRDHETSTLAGSGIEQVNGRPDAVADQATTNEDTPVVIDVRANDTDPENDALTVVSATNGAHGTVAIDPVSGNPVYTPNPNWNGTDSFSYTISDGRGGTSTATVTVTVSPINDAPVAGTTSVAPDGSTTADPNATGAGNYAHTIPEDTTVSGQVNATDVDGDALTFSMATGPAHGTVVVNPDGSYTYTPNPNYNGNDAFQVAVSDGNGGTAISTVAIIITPVADPSVISAGAGSVTEDLVLSTSGRLSISDPDGPQDQRFVAQNNAAGAHGHFSISEDGSWVYNLNNSDPAVQALNPGQTLTEVFTVAGVDGTPSTVTVVINGTAENAAPNARNDAATTDQDVSVTVNVLANDSDPDGDTLSIAGFGQGGSGTVTSVGNQLVYTPNAGFVGTDSFTYNVSDGRGGVSSATVTVTVGPGAPVDHAPVAHADTFSVTENVPYSGNLSVNDTPSADGGNVWTVATNPAHGTVVVSTDGTFTYTPTTNYFGPDSFTYTITDIDGSASTATVTLDVGAVNQNPVAVTDTATTNEDTPITIVVRGNDSDPDGDSLTVTTVTNGAHGTVAIDPVSGNPIYTPATNYTGSDNFTYTVSDGHGGTDTATVTVTVTPANDAPVANPDSTSTAINTPVTVPVLGNDTDVDGDTLTVTGITNGAHGSVSIDPVSGNPIYTPATNYTGSDSFTYTVSDGHGGTDTATVTVSVGANTPPTGQDATYTLAEDGSRTFAAGDFGFADADLGQTLQAVRVDSLPAAGSLSYLGNPVTAGQLIPAGDLGNLVYTPAANGNGNGNGSPYAHFTFSVEDSAGAFDTAPNTITLTVTPANDAPVAQNDTGAVNEDATLTVNATNGVILSTTVASGRDSDVDGDTLTVTTVRTGTEAGSGTSGSVGSGLAGTYGHLTLNANGSYEYVADQPAANLLATGVTATDAFTYAVSDGHGGTDTAQLTITVTGTNDIPVVAGSTVSGVEDTALTLVWANFGISDVDSPAITSVTISSLPADGTLQFYNGSTWANVTAGQSVSQSDVGAGNLRFVPDANESGGSMYGTADLGDQHVDYTRFQVSVTDTSGGTTTGDVTVDISPVVDSITLVADPSSTGSVVGGNTITRPDSVGLARDFFHNIPTLTSGAQSTDPTVLETGIEGATPTSTSTVTNIGVAGIGNASNNVPIATDDAYEVKGLMYMEAGKTYTFSGFADDSVRLEIGGETLVSGRWGSYGTNYHYDGAGNIVSANFAPTESGYYTVDLFLYNTTGPNGYDINVSVDGGAAQDLSSSNFSLYTSIANVDTVGAQHSGFVANATTGEGGYYPVSLNTGMEGTAIELSALTPTFGDVADNSERHVVTLSGIPVGAVISDGAHTYTATAGSTSAVLWNEDNSAAAADGSNWNLAKLTVTPPSGYVGNFDLTVTATATEIATGDATSATTPLHVTVVDANVAPVVGTPPMVNLSEEGLPGGIADTTGTSDTTNATVVSGNLAIVDPDNNGVFNISLTAPTTVLTSHGVAVTWTGGTSGADLVGMAGTTEVLRAHVTNTGAYTVTLSAPVDHATAGAEDVRTLNLGVSVSDGASSTSTTLTVNIEDDSPFMGSQHQAVTLPAQDTNLMIVLDISGSMADSVTMGGTTMTRLAATVSAIKTLLDSYDAFGNVAVRLVTFSTGADPHGTVWETVASAKTYLDTLSPSGNTNYDAALSDAMAAFTNSGKITGAQNVSYFFSDGVPTYSNNNVNTLSDTNRTANNNADEGIQSAEETTWKNFLNTNDINSYAMGLGTGVTQSNLNPIAWNGLTGVEGNGVVISDMNQLATTLAATVSTPVSGQILSGNALGAGWGIGADGGHLQSVGIDGNTFAFDPATGTLTASGGTYSYNATTHQVTINTSHGGVLLVDMDNGDYTYQANSTATSSYNEVLNVSLRDNDGDSAAGTLTLDVARAMGGSGNDVIIGTSAADLIIGGHGSDTMTGAAGSDTFRWVLGDATGAPTDRITDFSAAPAASGGDILDLRDLLVGETHVGTDAGNLANYLHFTYSGGNTTVSVTTHDPAATTQNIVLSGIDLVGSSSTDAQVIQNLLNNGKLITD